MNTTVIIIADGQATRWNNYMGIPKHMAPVDGESIIRRTSRLFREYGASRIYIVGPYKAPGARTMPAHHDYEAFADADKFMSSRYLWDPNARTIIAYGDVFFTEDAIKSIMQYKSTDWTLFGRFGPSEITGGKFAEIFAISVYPPGYNEMEAALRETARLYKHKVINRCGGWELYRVMNGLVGEEVRHRSPQPKLGRHFEIDDWCDDFDKPEDYKNFITRWALTKKAKSVQVIVPYKEVDYERARIWAYIETRWKEEYPDWPIIVGQCEGTWRKAVAIRDGLLKSEADIVVIADADVWCTDMERTVDALRAGSLWVRPHLRLTRLNHIGTEMVLNGGDTEMLRKERKLWEEDPYEQVPCGGIVAMQRYIGLEYPGDPRFKDWGGFDLSWSRVLLMFAGPHRQGLGQAIHLWHSPQVRDGRRESIHQLSTDLRAQYKELRNNREGMEELVAEGQLYYTDPSLYP